MWYQIVNQVEKGHRLWPLCIQLLLLKCSWGIRGTNIQSTLGANLEPWKQDLCGSQLINALKSQIGPWQVSVVGANTMSYLKIWGTMRGISWTAFFFTQSNCLTWLGMILNAWLPAVTNRGQCGSPESQYVGLNPHLSLSEAQERINHCIAAHCVLHIRLKLSPFRPHLVEASPQWLVSS